MERNTEACGRQHREVVGSVTDGDSLGNVDILNLSYYAQQLSLALAIDNVAHIAAGELTVDDLQLVGIYVVKSETLFEPVAEIGESARQNSRLISCAFQHLHHSVDALGYGKVFGNLPHHPLVKALEEGYTALKAFSEVNFTTHGTLGDGAHFSAHASPVGKFIDNFRLNECRIHIEAYQAAAAAEHIIFLK